MEDILDLYEEPADPTRPRVCFDELSYQLVAETRVPVPMAPGRPARIDYEYDRRGTANLFVHVDLDRAWRHVDVTAHRTKTDFAHQMRWLVDVRYPDAECIRVILDNLNTHTYAALYEAFEPAEARRLARKLELHYTPKHGSWLNQAEIELSVLSGQCLDRRIPDQDTLKVEVASWETDRNEAEATIEWRFTVRNARTKLHRLYPVLS
jgi:hypothetical protein